MSFWVAKLRSLFGAKFIAEDQFGNRYYEKGHRRMVMYKGEAEASKVPALYHTWLHGGLELPEEDVSINPKWLKGHLPNLSGTSLAYYPKAHISQASRSENRARGSYNRWVPADEVSGDG